MFSEVSKWHWMLDYCRARGLPSVQFWAWNIAKEAYDDSDNEDKDKD